MTVAQSLGNRRFAWKAHSSGSSLLDAVTGRSIQATCSSAVLRLWVQSIVHERGRVVVLAAVNHLIGHAVVGVQHVPAFLSKEAVGPAPAEENVVVRPPVDVVRAGPALDDVVAAAAGQEGVDVAGERVRAAGLQRDLVVLVEAV